MEADAPGVSLEIILIILLILANGVFAMCEMAVVSSRKSRLEQRVQQGNLGAKAALELSEDPGKMLSSIQIGITVIGIFTGAVGGATLSRALSASLEGIQWLEPWRENLSFGIVVVLITYMSLVVGELVPKRLALADPEGIASALARPIRLFSKLTGPIVHLLSVSTNGLIRMLGIKLEDAAVVTEAEIRQMVRESAETGGDVQPLEEKMVHRIFRLGDAKAESLMTPRTQLEWIDLEDPFEEILHQISASKHSRFPVAREGLDEVIGILYTRDVMRIQLEQKSVHDLLIREALFVPRSLPALELLELFRSKGMKEALVLDEYGGLSGMVTFYDVLAEVMGDLPSEEEGNALRRSDGSWLVDGIMPIQDFKEALGIEEDLSGEEEGNFNTVGGWVTYLAGHIPIEMEQYDWEDIHIEVLDMDRSRVDKVLVQVNRPDLKNENFEN